ncbi:transferase [Streptomyces sp. V2I9]|uniref:transferase n=1 Tax=Streptomyces sp. V2I9 TaxID=3042304 RepID=UPI00277EC4DB|nr:transferase [Streptomyces sp. V2I9]MDQ0983673.1 hypothetical protein [Streptomyces sp. V2I9]
MSPTAVRADCAADPGGTLTFHLTTPVAAAATLLLRRRGAAGAGPGGTVRIPLSGFGPGRSRAVLPASALLAEGRWDAYVEEPGAERARSVEPGLRDLRALVDRSPDTGAPGITARVPYPTADGRLALRCWVRAPHAEAGAVVAGPDGMTVEGVLYGITAEEGAAVQARLPGDPARVHTVPITLADGATGAFAFTLPYAPPAAGPVPETQLWQLWLVPAAGGERVRISRILDDVWSRHKSFVYPSVPAAPGVLATPCYTADNDLCLRLEPAPASG